jgi:hypothetical protein
MLPEFPVKLQDFFARIIKFREAINNSDCNILQNQYIMVREPHTRVLARPAQLALLASYMSEQHSFQSVSAQSL